MKKYLVSISLIAMLALPLAAQFGIAWSEPMPVAASTFGASSPKLGNLADGHIVAVWGKSGTQSKIFFSKKPLVGGFEPPTELNTGGLEPDIYGFGGLDMAVFGDNIFIVFENFGAGIHLIRSTNGGQDFLPPVTVFDPAPGDWATLSTIAVDGAGNPIVSVIRELVNETEARYIVMRSEDGGASFLQPVVASEPADGDYVCECCPSDMAVSGDSVWLVFRNNNANQRDVWVSGSTDGGNSFDVATDVDATDWVLNACPISGPRLAKIGGDSLLALWMSGASGQGRIYASTLHGGTLQKGWQFDFPPLNANSLQSFPSVAGSEYEFCAVWEETGFGANGTELVYRHSYSGEAAMLAQDSSVNLTNQPGNQKYPDLINDGVGYHLIYQSGGALEYRTGGIILWNDVAEEKWQEAPAFVLVQNPASGNIIVKIAAGGAAHFTLLDGLGRAVQAWPLRNALAGETQQLDLPQQVSGGIYFLKMEMDGKGWTEKVVVK